MSSEKNKIISSLCEYQAMALLEVESSDEEDELMDRFSVNMLCLLTNRRSIHFGVPKSSTWHRNVLPNFDFGRFTQMLRVRPEEFDYILSLVKDDPVFQSSACTLQLPVDLQLKIVLYRLGASGDGRSVRKVASIFGVGDGGTIINVTKRVINAILKLKSKFLCWPSTSERQQIVASTSNEMPGCIGYIDGSEIRLAEAPSRNHEMFFSRKRQYSIKMQVICDYKLRIRQVTVGYPGSVHDAKIFSECALAKHPQRYISAPQWIAGDSAYPLKPFLLTPFRQNSAEYTQQERETFNKHFSRYRVRIENCFGGLKERFGSLKELGFRMQSAANRTHCNDWIMACCILHNILLDYKDKDDNSVLPHYNLPPESNTRNSLLHFIQTMNE